MFSCTSDVASFFTMDRLYMLRVTLTTAPFGGARWRDLHVHKHEESDSSRVKTVELLGLATARVAVPPCAPRRITRARKAQRGRARGKDERARCSGAAVRANSVRPPHMYTGSGAVFQRHEDRGKHALPHALSANMRVGKFCAFFVAFMVFNSFCRYREGWTRDSRDGRAAAPREGAEGRERERAKKERRDETRDSMHKGRQKGCKWSFWRLSARNHSASPRQHRARKR